MPCRMKLSNKLNTVPGGKICADFDFFFMLNMAYWDLSQIKSMLDKDCVLIHFVNRANNNTKVFVLVNLFDKCFVEKHVEVFIRTKTHGPGLGLIEKIISVFEKYLADRVIVLKMSVRLRFRLDLIPRVRSRQVDIISHFASPETCFTIKTPERTDNLACPSIVDKSIK